MDKKGKGEEKKMKIIGDLVILRSTEPYYSREKSGAKPNTERLMSTEEIEWLLEHEPKITRIRIEWVATPNEYFDRELTDILIVSELLGFKLVVLSWKHEGIVEVLK